MVTGIHSVRYIDGQSRMFKAALFPFGSVGFTRVRYVFDIQPDRLVKIHDSTVQIALLSVDGTAVIVSGGAARIKADHLAEIRNSSIKLSFRSIAKSPDEVPVSGF